MVKLEIRIIVPMMLECVIFSLIPNHIDINKYLLLSHSNLNKIHILKIFFSQILNVNRIYSKNLPKIIPELPWNKVFLSIIRVFFDKTTILKRLLSYLLLDRPIQHLLLQKLMWSFKEKSDSSAGPPCAK